MLKCKLFSVIDIDNRKYRWS